MDPLVKAFDSNGERVLVPQSKVAELEELGGRVATKEDLATLRLQEKYDNASTLEKISGAVTGIGAIHPVLDAIHQGATAGFTADAEQVLVHEAVRAYGGDEAAKRYTEHLDDIKEAHGGLYKTGEAAGILGGALVGAAGGGGALGNAAKLAPSALISSAGNLAERGAARLVGGVASRGVMGRAVATGLTYGAQGTAEGLLYGAADQISEDLLHDKDVAADRVAMAAGMSALYGGAGGFALGGLGSLASSGARTVGSAAFGGLARMADSVATKVGKAHGLLEDTTSAIRNAGGDAVGAVRKASQEATEAASSAAAKVRSAADDAISATGTNVATERNAAGALWDAAKNTDKQKEFAHRLLFNQTAAGNGQQSTRYVKLMQKAKLTPEQMGEVAVRYGVYDMKGGIVAAAENAAPDAIAARLARADATVGAKLGEVYESVGATVSASDVHNAYQRVIDSWKGRVGFENVARSLDQHRNSMFRTLNLADPRRSAKWNTKMGRVGEVSFQDAMQQRMYIDDLVYKETKALDPKARVEALREMRGDFDRMLLDKIEQSSASSTARADVKALRRDFQAIKILREMADDTAARQTKSAAFGFLDTMRSNTGATVGAAIAGPAGATVGSVVGAVGSKIIRERGNAAAAVLLYRMAEVGSITKAMNAIEGKLTRAAKGIVVPKSLPRTSARGPAVDPVKRASVAQKRIAALVANPEAVANRTAALTGGMHETSPGVASKVAMNLTRSVAFLHSKFPPNPHVDPLSPKRERKLSQTEATKVVRYVDAAENPAGILDRFERGKVTPEDVETLKVLYPTVYADLQTKTLDQIATSMASGKPISFETRIRLGALFGVPADPSQDPRIQKYLQNNIATATQQASGAKISSAGPAPRPLKIATQHSEFDRVSEGRLGK